MADNKRTIPPDVIEDNFSFNLTVKRKKNEKEIKYKALPTCAFTCSIYYYFL